MKSTIRLIAAQALVSYCMAQLTEDREPFIAGVWTIFDHGNVAELGEALFERSGIKGPFVVIMDTDPYPST